MAVYTITVVALALFAGCITASPAEENRDVVSAYPVKWDASIYAPPPARTADPVLAYPVKWDLDASVPAPPSSEGNGYPRKWEPPSPRRTKAPVKPHHVMVKTGVLFLKRALYPGAVLPRGTKLSYVGAVRPLRARTDEAVPPFEYRYLGRILARFNIYWGSEKAEEIAETLRFCSEEIDDHKEHEPHTCATSRQAAMHFAATTLGVSHPRAVRSIIHGREPLRYVVVPDGITPISNPVVACHPLPYPYEVYHCHRPAGVQALKVQLIGKDEPSVGATAIAVCHANTTNWDASFSKMLHGVQGEPICHYMPQNYVLYVAA